MSLRRLHRAGAGHFLFILFSTFIFQFISCLSFYASCLFIRVVLFEQVQVASARSGAPRRAQGRSRPACRPGGISPEFRHNIARIIIQLEHLKQGDSHNSAFPQRAATTNIPEIPGTTRIHRQTKPELQTLLKYLGPHGYTPTRNIPGSRPLPGFPRTAPRLRCSENGHLRGVYITVYYIIPYVSYYIML